MQAVSPLKQRWSRSACRATSANIGPGFDCFGLALELRDRYAAQVLDDETFDVDVTGEGAEEVKKDSKNLVIKSMLRGFEHMGGKPRGIALRDIKCYSTWQRTWIISKCNCWRISTSKIFGFNW